MSSLLRSSSVHRALSVASGGAKAAFLRNDSTAAADAARRHLSTQNGAPAASSSSQDDKTDLERKHLQELEQTFNQIVSEHVKLHKEVHSSDRDYFERYLSEHGWPKCKSRDIFVWRCKLAAIFGASVMFGYMLPEIGYPS